MALRDRSLDDKITKAAMDEFLDKGYMHASLRQIAAKAGVTVGAIQTRYSSKDELFTSLLKSFLEGVKAAFQTIRTDYYSGTGPNLLSRLQSSMQHESEVILHLIFSHYSEAVLLLYRSAGSSLEHAFDQLVKSKIEESILFFNNAGYHDIDEKLLGLLISSQFDSYRRIIAECPDRQSAEFYMHSLMIYHTGGWNTLFHSFNTTKEDP